jgi:nucleoside-diphosphate-sugar epimerase
MVNQQTVLVSGANGFTGRHLTAALTARGYQVVKLTKQSSDQADTVSCDLDDTQALCDTISRVAPTYVIHLAALSFVDLAQKPDYYTVNLFGTENLLTALAQLESCPKKIILASSANVYGNPPTTLVDESICPNPVNHYAISKLAMEQMAKTWFDRLPILITRPFNYTGVGQAEHFLIPKIVSHFARRAPDITLGNTDIERDFSDVAFVAEAYCRLLETDATAQIVNICSGHSHSITHILRLMADIAGYEINVTRDPNLMRANDLKKLMGSNAKLASLVGQIPIIPLAQTLQKMYDDNLQQLPMRS